MHLARRARWTLIWVERLDLAQAPAAAGPKALSRAVAPISDMGRGWVCPHCPGVCACTPNTMLCWVLRSAAGLSEARAGPVQTVCNRIANGAFLGCIPRHAAAEGQQPGRVWWEVMLTRAAALAPHSLSGLLLSASSTEPDSASLLLVK